MLSPLIIALDYPSLDEALVCARKLDPTKVRLKVGKQLFSSEGPRVLDALHGLGFDVFLDLKFHDIPNSVAGAVGAAAAKSLPEGAETEAAARGGASAGALVVSTQI